MRGWLQDMAAFLAALLILLAAAWLLGATDARADVRIPQRAEAYRRLLVRCAHASPWGLNAPVATLAAQVHAESLWRPDALSPVGAQGLGQFMPATARWWAELMGRGEAEPWNPGWSLRALAGYDFWLHKRVRAVDGCHRWAKTLAAYNGGLGWVRRDERLAASLGLDPRRWWNATATVNAGRGASAKRENRAYPDKILLRFEPAYEAAGWGRGVCP